MRQHDSKYFAHIPPPRTLGWVKWSKFNFFLDHGRVTYQIKGNDEYSKMQAHILSLHVPSTTGVGSTFKTYHKIIPYLHLTEI